MSTTSLPHPGLREVLVRRRGGPPSPDVVAVEEPLEIRVDGRPLVVTMRTPGHDAELAAGFLWAEGVIDRPTQIRDVTALPGLAETGGQIRVTSFRGDRVEVTLDGTVAPPAAAPAAREFRATAACGVCGKTELDDLDRGAGPVEPVETDLALLGVLPDRLRGAQSLFDATGGIHAAGLFDLDGTLLWAREDIGRHNAVDKVIGHAVLAGQAPLPGRILVVSGRAGFELVQKALRAAIPVMVSVGAASSLAVSMATEAGMALYSFAGPDRGNLHVRS